MNLIDKYKYSGMIFYAMGWIILIVSGYGIIETFGLSFALGGIFLLSCWVTLLFTQSSGDKNK